MSQGLLRRPKYADIEKIIGGDSSTFFAGGLETEAWGLLLKERLRIRNDCPCVGQIHPIEAALISFQTAKKTSSKTFVRQTFESDIYI